MRRKRYDMRQKFCRRQAITRFHHRMMARRTKHKRNATPPHDYDDNRAKRGMSNNQESQLEIKEEEIISKSDIMSLLLLSKVAFIL